MRRPVIVVLVLAALVAAFAAQRQRAIAAAGPALAVAGRRATSAQENLTTARVRASALASTTAMAGRRGVNAIAHRSVPTLSAARSLSAAAFSATARGFLILLTLALLATSIPSGFATVQASDLAREEAPAILGLGATVPADMPSERHQYRVARDVATYLDSLELADGSVVIDVALGFWVVLQSERPRQFVITPDRDFEAVVADPATFGAKYLLVSPASGVGSLSAISRAYPGIFQNGAGIGTLEREFLSPGGEQHTWRLYRVDD